MNILVYRLSALGDVAMTIPAVYSVARTYPGHHFTVVTAAFTARLFINPPSNVEVIGIPKDESSGVAGTWRLLRRLRSMPIDAVCDLHNVLRSWVVDAQQLLSGRRVVMLDKHRRERRAILHDHALVSRPVTECYFDVFARLGLPARPRFTSLFPDGRPPLPQGFMRGADERWVGIAPFARYRTKTYDLAQMQKVVGLLAGKGCRVFLFGARGAEEKVLNSWASTFERQAPHNPPGGDGGSAPFTPAVVAGRLQIEEELALMAHMDVMLTMDSANMHMASLVATRVVSLWGGTTPACGFLGYGQRTGDALLPGLSCQPCSIGGSKTCPLHHLQCTKALTPETIAGFIDIRPHPPAPPEGGE